MSAVPTAGPASSSSLTPIMSLGSPATVEHDPGLQPMTPLASLLPPLPAPSTSEAVSVGMGAPEVTLRDLMSNRDKPKEPKRITSIQQWVVCFHSVISVMPLKHPECVQDLFGYSSMITKASLDYEGTPWLAYNAHFRRLAAADRLTQWSQIDASFELATLLKMWCDGHTSRRSYQWCDRSHHAFGVTITPNSLSTQLRNRNSFAS